jgi:hypothetical protein
MIGALEHTIIIMLMNRDTLITTQTTIISVLVKRMQKEETQEAMQVEMMEEEMHQAEVQEAVTMEEEMTEEDV